MLFTMRKTYVDRNPKSHIVLGNVPVAIIDRQLPFEYTITSKSTDAVVPISSVSPTDSEYLRSGMRYMIHNEVAYLMLGSGKIQKSNKKLLKDKGKGKANGKENDKQVYIHKPKNPKPYAKEHPAKDDTCHHCKEVGHYDESFDQCVSCLSGKMTRKSFPRRPERAIDLLGIINTDVCGPVRNVSSQGASYFITFTYDYSRYGYVYLLKHKHELTPPYTPQHNRVSERRNHTLLDMVRSMMNLTTLSLSFWDYALESATRILNMVPTKKVDKTPYELWKQWVTIFYFPPENKIVVARYAKFFEKNHINQEVSGRAMDLEEIQDEDTSPSEITSEIPMEVEGFEPPQEEVISVRRSERTHQTTDHLCLNVKADEHSIVDLNEPTSYKAAILDSESNKWIDAMNAKIQSMIDNMVWVLVDLPLGCKTVGGKWIFMKKTNMDGIVYTYKARLVAKGYTQLYGVNYEEVFSPVADIRAIRILISIAAFLLILIIPEKYARFKDQFMVLSKHQEARIEDLMKKSKDLGEAAFILGIKIYRDRSKRFIGLGQNAYIDKILKRYKMDNSKCGHIPMQERLDLNKTQGASTPKEVKRMQNVPYASAVGSIMYAVRCTRPNVAFAQNITSWFSQNPGKSHWTTVKNILKYLRNIKDMFLVYSGNLEAELRVDCYCNAGFETDIDDMKSLIGYVFVLNGSAVD
ncbi:retrotransposon protein, putative, ty1-copia subclass [Tanacetum coccineum]